jgi:hypothetical protein
MNTKLLHCTLAALLCVAITAHAQTTTTTVVPAVRTTVLRAVSAALANAAADTNAVATNATKAKAAPKVARPGDPLPPELTNAIHVMSFDRSSESLFDAVKSQQSGGKLSESEKFRLALLLGDWGHIATALKTLPDEDAMTAYTRLLDSLTTNSQSAAQFYQQSRSSGASSVTYDQYGNMIPAASAPSPSNRRGLFLSDDFYAVIEAAPGQLTASHLPSISSLVKVAIGSGGKQDFLVRLEKGLKGIGGTTPSGKKLAAQLLSSVGWMSDSGPYLPLDRSEWDNADTLTLVLTMEYFTQTGVEKRDERQLKRAAEMCAFMMQTSRFGSNDRGIFKQATDRFVKLLPALESDDAEQLIRENFLTQPAIMIDLVLALGDVGHQAQKSSDLKQREQSLKMQSVILRVLEGKKSALPEAVNVLVMNWLSEAEQTYRSGGRTQEQNMMDSDIYLYRVVNTTARPKTLAPDVILDNAPSGSVTKRLNQGLAQRVNLTRLKVTLLNPTEMTLDTLKGYLKDHPGQEKELCQDYLAAWVKKRMVQPEDPNIVRMRLLGYNIAKPPTQGIPLTRLRQNQNVTEFRNVLASLRALSPEPIEASSVISSFMSIHSGAEVYRLEDIEGIFGPPEKMNRAELMSLVTGMRTKLREQWRDPQAQQDAGSNRTETEVKDEVSRGYRTALELVKRGLKPEDAEWKEFIVRGQLFFDASEYEFSRQIKLTDYVSLRDEAFNSYKKASEIYAAKVPDMAKGQWTMEPYQMWFFVMLGASDLSQLTRAAARSDPGLKLVGDAMRALPGEAADGHLTKFGEMLGTVLGQVPANMKQKFLSAGLQVIGENHPSAKTAGQSLKNYEELIDEVQLRLAVDGPTRVGHKTPFGVFIGIEHTRQLARESGGFSKYLQNLQSQQRNIMYYGNAGQKAINYRDEFSKNIHAALDETFEVASITFPDTSVKLIDLPREGWQETPLAYVVLRAKDAAVDRIPSIQIDMDFSDTAGQVVLPIRSQVQPIDAKDADVTQRPYDGLALTLTMDEREWRKEGKVVVEVTAKGTGVIPSHLQMFDYEREGFDTEVTDNGLSITQFLSDGKKRTAQADRGWQFTYKRKKDLRGDVTLKFPAIKPSVTVTNVEYKHYQDADLVSVDAKQAAAGVLLRSGGSSLARNIGVTVGVVGLAVGLFMIARRRPQQTQAVDGLTVPAQITPFSVVAFLQRIQREYAAKLDEGKRQSLQAQIREIESAFFSGGNSSATSPDLEAVARKWLQAVG